MAENSLSIVVPCHNSANHIHKTLNELTHFLNDHDYEIIAVENGSSDNTLELLESYKSEHLNLELKILQSKKGLGNALRCGFDNCLKNVSLFVADDLPFGLQEIETALKIDQNLGKHISIFSKYKSFAGLKRSLFRNLMGIGFAFLRETFLFTHVLDSQGTILGKTDQIKKISSLSREEGYLVSTELIKIAKVNKFKVIEIPVHQIFDNRTKSTIKPKDVIEMIKGLARIRGRRQLYEINLTGLGES